MIKSERIKKNGEYVLYWMQQSQREEYNHALEFSILKANEYNLPLIVYFGLTEYPEANERQYYFMLEGLKEVKVKLEKRGIKFILLNCSPEKGAIKLGKKAKLLVKDKGYLRIQKLWTFNLVKKINCLVYEIETDLVLPVEFVSKKEEYTAYTFRKKAEKILPDFLIKLDRVKINKSSLSFSFENELDINNIKNLISMLSINNTVKKSNYFIGGNKEAKKLLKQFIKEKLKDYGEKRNDPTLNLNSQLSSYLHFGQISSLYIILEILNIKNKINKDSVESFLEELIIRRELAFNFVYYNKNYDNYYLMNANWALKTLEEHKNDKRDDSYTLKELENAQTYDNAWNTAQKEMCVTGKMQSYMRMYWGKKIIEWTENPEEAFKRALYLNNKYCIDGRDANSFAGVAWCFGKHDRAWKERKIFGKIRYMNYHGLKRKFDIKKYESSKF